MSNLKLRLSCSCEIISLTAYHLIVLYSLKEILSEFLDRQGLPEFKELDHFPDDLLVCHVAMTWKEIVQHQSKISK